MIIVSQNRIVLVNFNLVERIDIEANLDGTGEIPYKIYYETESTREELGEYKTAKRAEEVLQEIVKLYEQCEYVSGKYTYTAINKPKVYEMPEN